jgi:hypothetical protein
VQRPNASKADHNSLKDSPSPKKDKFFFEIIVMRDLAQFMQYVLHIRNVYAFPASQG